MRLRITDEAFNVLRAWAEFELYEDSSEQLPSGEWMIPIDEEVLSRLGQLARKNNLKTPSEVILYVDAIRRSKLQ